MIERSWGKYPGWLDTLEPCEIERVWALEKRLQETQGGHEVPRR